jgi:hypothetical protein
MLFAPRGRVAQWQSSGLLSHWLKVRVLPRSFYILSHWLKVRWFAEPSLPRSFYILSHWLKVRRFAEPSLPRSFYILSHWLKVRRFAEPSLPRSLNRRFEAEKPYKTAFFSHQDLPEGRFLRLIPHLIPIWDTPKKWLRIYFQCTCFYFCTRQSTSQ